MDRLRVLTALALVLAVTVPVAAEGPAEGVVMLPAPPGVAKAQYNATRSDGLAGAVIPLSPNADGKRYTLTTVGGATGLEEFDVWFYKDLQGPARGPGEMCSRTDAQQSGRVETGSVCIGDGGAEWAVVVLFTGARGRFTLAV